MFRILYLLFAFSFDSPIIFFIFKSFYFIYLKQIREIKRNRFEEDKYAK